MKSTSFGIKNFPEFLESVDKKLLEQVPEYIGGVERLLRTSGNRWRPSIVLIIAHYSDRRIDDEVIRIATAVELVHLASLIHDDIMDNGTVRRGEPTINSLEGVDSAILAGDYLLSRGCVLASSVSEESGVCLAQTISALCEGQANELSNRFNIGRTAESLRSAIRGKTSSMFVAACKLGGLVAGFDADNIKTLSEFGDNFGVAYQYLDDIKDLVESPESAGKSVGNDIREGNYTLPVILSLEGSNGPLLKKLLRQKATSIPQILEILKLDDSIKRATKEADGYRQKAILKLRKLDNVELAKALESFINTL